ncbi:MAG: 50S ribosomal protein L24 [Candidatus Eisenbacteria bacterium]|nr:50S ribosomal protein L24 [Candidatus Eisenbacteria bacterium]
MRIAKNDTVEVIAGNDRGKRGKVLKVFPETNRVLVEGVNFVHRHTRPRRQGDQGGIIEKEAPLNASNVLLVCTKCNGGVRVRTKVLTDKSKARVCTKCGEMIERR